jgi:hypothetical protein
MIRRYWCAMEAAKCASLTGSGSCSLQWRRINWLVGKGTEKR